MKIIQSLWTRPANGSLLHTYGWPTIQDFARGQLLSVLQARKVYGKVHLITDRFGANLMRSFGIAYNSMEVILDQHADPRWWAWGKLKAYSMQKEPFLHIDGDVFLWERLPEDLETAPLICQSFEDAALNYPGFDSIYDGPRHELETISHSLPECWQHTADRVAINAGILGGHDVETIRGYATEAMAMMTPTMAATHRNVFVEQQLAYCYAKQQRKSWSVLLDGTGRKFSHLMSSKQDAEVCAKIKQRLATDFPAESARLDRQLHAPVPRAIGRSSGGCGCRGKAAQPSLA